MKKFIDWIKFCFMVIAGIMWIVISDYGFLCQLFGMSIFLVAAFTWASTDQAARWLIKIID